MSTKPGALEYLPQSRQQPKADDKKVLEAKKQQGYIEEPPINVAGLVCQEQVSFYDEVNQNSDKTWAKVYKLAKYNPFVPLGCLFTMGVLANGVWAMRKRDTAKSQRMMRLRIAAQGTTIIALVVGTMFSQYWITMSQSKPKPSSD